MAAPDKRHISFPNMKYPSLRDEGWKDGSQWLEGKSLDDGADSLWRIHDKLYDLNDFIKRHPGGQDWIVLTKGTDITEVFESHHISDVPLNLLPKYYAKDASTSRNSPFTFEDNGFYRTLRRRLRSELKDIDTNSLEWKSKIITDGLLASVIAVSYLACIAETWTNVMKMVLLNGIFVGWLIVAAHNYIHRKDNWRMYLWNLGTSSYRDARISHAISHHMFPNTLWDMEISGFEPLTHYFPQRKKPGHLYYFLIYGPILFLNTYWIQFIGKIVMSFSKEGYFKSYYLWHDLITILPPILMYCLTPASLLKVVIVWASTVTCATGVVMFTGVTAGHHHPDAFHDGDVPKGTTVDWGEHQLETIVDRPETSDNLFLRLTNFGDHGLHHLFPTLDHAILPLLYPTFYKVCREFGTGLRMANQIDQMTGHQTQMRRTNPTTVANRYKLSKQH